MKNVYFISGLGADYRMFSNIELRGCTCTHLPWLKPENAEPIEHYARRMANMIKEKEAYVIGMSFGGIMAIEVSKHIALEKVILISSIKNKDELPFYYKIAGFLNLDKWLPLRVIGRPSKMMEFLFGAKRPDEKKLLGQIIRDTDTYFYKWAAHKILRWQNKHVPVQLYHIHGTADLILPYFFIKNVDYTIKGGGHIMVLNRSEEINTILNNILK